MREINEIIVHCTATRADWWPSRSTTQKVNEVRKWHVEGNGWSDIGYHYLIDRDGTIAEGRPVETAGAHTRGHNSNSVGISLFGGHGSTKTDAFSDNFTPEQAVALQNLIERLKTEYPTITKVSGHNEYANKACPGFQVGPWLNNRPAPKHPELSVRHQTTILKPRWCYDQDHEYRHQDCQTDQSQGSGYGSDRDDGLLPGITPVFLQTERPEN